MALLPHSPVNGVPEVAGCSSPGVPARRQVYFEKIRVLKAGFTRLDIRAWNNGIGRRFYFVGFRSPR